MTSKNQSTKVQIRVLTPAIFLAVLSFANPAAAFNGYFASGIGVRAKAMAGASTAMIGDAFAGANNPAASLFSGNVYEIGLQYTHSHQSASRTGNGTGPYPNTDMTVSGTRTTYTPEFGYNEVLSADASRGISFYRNGMIRSGYDNNSFFERLVDDVNLTRHPDTLRFSLTQDVIAPVFAWRVGNESSFGVAPLFVVQNLKINGLKSFIENDWSKYTDNVTDRGSEQSYGVGVRLGWLTRPDERLMLGMSYSPKIQMSRFEDYKGLFAGNARFNVPENYAIGVSYALNPNTILAIDYQKIRYSKVKLLSNSASLLLDSNIEFGEENGPGLGWRDVEVWKLGYEWRYSQKLTFRFGLSLNNSPIDQSDVSQGVIMPGITTSERSIGGTYRFDNRNSVSVFMSWASGPEINGVSTIVSSGAREIVDTRTHSAGIQFSRQF